MTFTPTLKQLPATAAQYYMESVGTAEFRVGATTAPPNALFDYTYLGKDEAGFPVFQKGFDGEEWGEPQSLLPFARFAAHVKEWARLLPRGSIGVLRWTPVTGDVR